MDTIFQNKLNDNQHSLQKKTFHFFYLEFAEKIEFQLGNFFILEDIPLA